MKICKKIALLVMIFMLSTTFNTYAADYATDSTSTGAEITLTPSVSSAKVGETVTITVSAKTAAGLEGVDATLEYDKTKLEFTNSEQLAATGFTSMSGVDESTGNFKLSVLYTGSGAAPAEANFATLTFKVLDVAIANEELSVKLSEIEVGDSNDEWMTVEDKEVELTVVEDAPADDEEQNPDDGEQQPGDEEQNPGDEEQQPGNTEQNPENQEQPKDDTIADKPINNAGLETYGFVAMLAIVAAIVLYAKCKQYRDVK